VSSKNVRAQNLALEDPPAAAQQQQEQTKLRARQVYPLPGDRHRAAFGVDDERPD